ncbi:MAG: hypothetical protein ACOYZ8_08225 [Chloroflexota bacterium]
MATQNLTLPVMICNFLLAPEESIFADSRDYGFDLDKDELARELLAPLPASLPASSLPEVDADEFEQTFHFFLS